MFFFQNSDHPDIMLHATERGFSSGYALLVNTEAIFRDMNTISFLNGNM